MDRSLEEKVMAFGSWVIWVVFFRAFPAKIPVNRGMLPANREFHVVVGVVIFPTHPGLRINLQQVGKTLRASVTTSVGKFRSFQQNLISSACFHARGRRSSRCRISTILVSSESLCYLFSKGTSLAQRQAWVRKIWSYEQRLLECSLCQGVIFWSRFRLDRGSSWRSSFWSGPWLGQTLVKLGQP